MQMTVMTSGTSVAQKGLAAFVSVQSPVCKNPGSGEGRGCCEALLAPADIFWWESLEKCGAASSAGLPTGRGDRFLSAGLVLSHLTPLALLGSCQQGAGPSPTSEQTRSSCGSPLLWTLLAQFSEMLCIFSLKSLNFTCTKKKKMKKVLHLN